VLGNVSVNIPAATNAHATTEELLDVAFSIGSVPRLYNEDQTTGKLIEEVIQKIV
jgi:hypothetical protein